MDGLSDLQIREVLTATRRIAVVGASNKPARASYGVMQFLLDRGFEVVPVNPALGARKCWGSLW